MLVAYQFTPPKKLMSNSQSDPLDPICHVQGKSSSCSRWLGATEAAAGCAWTFPRLQAGEGGRRSISWVCAEAAGPLWRTASIWWNPWAQINAIISCSGDNGPAVQRLGRPDLRSQARWIKKGLRVSGRGRVVQRCHAQSHRPGWNLKWDDLGVWEGFGVQGKNLGSMSWYTSEMKYN